MANPNLYMCFSKLWSLIGSFFIMVPYSCVTWNTLRLGANKKEVSAATRLA